MKNKCVTLLLAFFVIGSSICLFSQQRILVAYFSYSGNTRVVAQDISKKTSADIFEIKTTVPYSKDYKTVVDIARKELDNDVRPDIESFEKDIEQYDIIFLGYPNWWATYPQAVKVFLSQHNFKGKIIIPFCTHEGSGLGESVNDLKTMCPSAIIGQGLALRGSNAHQSGYDIDSWLKRNEINKIIQGYDRRKK